MTKDKEIIHAVVLVLGNATHFSELEHRLLSFVEEENETSLSMLLLQMLDYLDEFVDDVDAFVEDDTLNRQILWTDKLRRFISRLRSFVERYEGEDEDTFLAALDDWVEEHTT
ncbi:hypothetical protein IKI14_03420 [bacterium]|nr:hypothetical protein [bacterium]